MKTLFIHTAEKVKIDSEGNYYTDGSYNNEIWKRYLSFSDSIVFISRFDKKEKDDKVIQKKYNKIESKEIEKIIIDDINESIISYLNIFKRIRIKNQIKNEIKKADFIIIRMPCDFGGYAIKYSKKYSKKYMVECVACVFDALWNYSFKGKVLAIFKYLFMKKNIFNSNSVVYVTNNFLQNRYPTKGNSIECSNVMLKTTDYIDLNKRIEKIKNTNSKIILGTLAAIDVPFKGQEYVIRALPYLIKKGINVSYQIVGAGSDDRLRKIATENGVLDNVEFLGALPHERINEWIDQVDIYIQPSKQEGLPRSLLEAMSRGCPCIGSNAGGIPELLNPKYIFKKGNVASFVKTFLNLYDIKHMESEAEKNYKTSSHYCKEKIDEKRYEFIKKILN